MSKRTLKRLLLALMIAGGIWASLFLRDRYAGGSDDDSGIAAALAQIDHDAVDRVEIFGPADTVTLTLAEGRWRANGYAADAALVDRIWAALAEADVVGTAGTNPDNHERFGVAGPDAWSVTFHEGNSNRTTFIVGRAGTRFSSSYVRLPDQPVVVTVLGNLRGTLARTLDQWRDREVAALDTAAVHALIQSRDGQTVEITRDGDAWFTSSGSAVDADAVRNVLQELAGLSASGFAPDSLDVHSGPERRQLSVLGAGGDTLLALVASQGENSVHVQRLGDPTVFSIARWRADRLFPPLDALR